MADLIFRSAEVTKTVNSKTARMYAHIYVEYTVSDSPGSATITASVKGRVGEENAFYANWYSVLLILEGPFGTTHADSIGYWRLNNDTTAQLKKIDYESTSSTITLSTASKTATITKTHSSQSIPVLVNIHGSAYLQYRSGSGAGNLNHQNLNRIGDTLYITIPAKPSYVVTYDANGGINPPASQTKWYGETLTLSTSQPLKSGYTFKGWATSVEHASAGTVDYAAGASYTGNDRLSLYAVWELTYQKPTIQNLHVERCVQNGTLDDEGTYALVSFDWAVFRSTESRYYGGNTTPYANNSVETCTITVGTQNATLTLTGASGHGSKVVGVGSYDVDTAYNATVSITDSQEISTNNTTTVNGALPMAFFPLDYNADASAVGFFMPAPNDGNGAYFAKTIHIAVDMSASIGTTDYEIRNALNNLGWSSLLE